MGADEIAVVGIASLLTSVLSAVAGLGGGIILLVVIAQFVAPTVAIPIQGVIQFASNGSRAVLVRRDISWPAVGWSALLVLPGSLVGVWLATSIPEAALRLVLGVFVLVVALRPSLLRWTSAERPSDRSMIGVGALSGFLNSTVGASGPVTSPFFRAVTSTHVAFVATAGAAQVLAHVAKLISFTSTGFSVGDHLGVIGVGCLGVIVGSRIGTALLGRIPARRLDVVFTVVLSALAIRLVVTALGDL